MLNTTLKIFCFSIVFIFFGAFSGHKVVGQETVGDDEIRVIGLADALNISREKFRDTISDAYLLNVKSQYYKWIYCHNRLKVLNEKKELYCDFKTISELHYKSGETDLISKTLAEADYIKVGSQYSDAANDVFISENNLKKLLFINNDIQPESDSLDKYSVGHDKTGIMDNDSLADDYSDFILLREYTNQELLLRKYDDQLKYYSNVPDLVRQIIEAVRFRYEHEDIEYFDYIDLISSAIDLKLEYLKTLNLYNQSALKVEFYFKYYLHNESF